MDLHARDVRRDVRELGELLGDVLEAQTSAEAFDLVESVRTKAIDYRRGDADSREALRAELDDLPSDLEGTVARAFTTYFELVNLAEERERVRAVREGSQAGTLPDSVAAAADALAGAGADAETVQRVLDDVLVEPTFTAHPTEARRKTVKSKLRAVAGDLEALDERRLTDRERARIERDLESEVTSLWQTPQVRDRRPEVTDEALNVQWYLENVLFDVVGEVYDELERELGGAFEGVEIPELFEFRSWAGSDRDGNPYVTPEVTAETLARQREVAVERYRAECKRLSGVLSQSDRSVAVSDDLRASLDADRERLPGVAGEAEERYPGEPYRQKLRLIRERLDRVGDVRPGEYEDAAELRADADVIAESLRANGAAAVAEAEVDPLRRRIETFGLTLASLDLRDHQKNHTAAVGEALSREGIEYETLDEDERVEILTEAVMQDDPVIDVSELASEARKTSSSGVSDAADLSDAAARVLELFDRTADWQAEYGAQAIDTYCISMTEEPSHVLEVLFLADQAGVVNLPDYSGLDVVPLLETEYALSGARRIMGTLFDNEAYAAALDARGNTQEIMLGYSDSNKENGFLAANWSLYRNQKRLADICDDYDVRMRLFHGRGGSISRGGGPMNAALLALPNETVSGQVKFTEQGEAIAEKYANPRIAERNLEQMLDAQLRARHEAIREPTEDVPDEWIEVMDAAADAARESYRDLLETEGFVSYFEQATPITVIEELHLGSRPASRSGERTVEDLRAIPWVFSWTQSRAILPGWYSLAAGLDAYLDGEAQSASNASSADSRAAEPRDDDETASGGDLETLREMYEEWPFFRTTLDNAALALARTDLEIAAEYAGLAEGALRERFFPEIESEYDRAVELVTDVAGRDGLLTREWLEESLARRNPYVDPLSLLQTRLLARDDRTPEAERTLRLTVKGIAAGMKNTG